MVAELSMSDEDKVLLREGNRFYDAGDFEEAFDLFKRIFDAGQSWVGINVGNALRKLGRLSESLPYYAAAAELGDLDSRQAFADCLEELGRVREARAHYQKLVELDHAPAMIALAWLEHEINPERARLLLRRAAQSTSPAANLAAGILGHWLWDSGQSQDAVPLLHQGYEDYPSARSDLASFLFAEGQSDRAVDLLQAGMPEGASEFAILLGNAAWDRGDLNEARRWYVMGAAAGDGNSVDNLRALEADG